MRGEISWLQVRGKAKKKLRFLEVSFFFFLFFDCLQFIFTLWHSLDFSSSGQCNLFLVNHQQKPQPKFGSDRNISGKYCQNFHSTMRLLYILWCFKCFPIRQGGGRDTKTFLSHQDVLKKSLLRVRSLVFKCSELFLTKGSLSYFISWVKRSHMQ